jgi:flagellar hook protein FlgE
LNKVGSYFIETNDSGPSVNNKPGSGGLGELQSSSLEMSNTDTAKEFIKMITAQRAYQSSAKIIATADQMLQTLMNVKQ